MANKINVVNTLGLLTMKLADRKPSLPIIQFMEGKEKTVPLHMAEMAESLGIAKIIGESSQKQEDDFSKSVLLELGFSEKFIELLSAEGITTKEELNEFSYLSLLHSTSEKFDVDAADHARLKVMEKGLSLRPNSLADLALIGEDCLKETTIKKLEKAGLNDLSKVVTYRYSELKEMNGIGDGTIKELVHSLGGVGMELAPEKEEDEDIDLGPE